MFFVGAYITREVMAIVSTRVRRFEGKSKTVFFGKGLVITATHAIEVDYRYLRDQLDALFVLARAQDVEKGGRYDARSGAINIYTHPWNSPTMQEESTLMCRGARTSSILPENRGGFCARLVRIPRGAYLRTAASYLRTSRST
jgi:hypothetical protein